MKSKPSISAYMLKKKDGNQYKVPGSIISINESQQTVDMSFIKKDGSKKIVRGISQKDVIVNEAFIDNIRDFGSKIASGAKKVFSSVKEMIKRLVVRVGKFICIKDPDTENILGESYGAFVNVAAGKEPDGVTFVASKKLQQLNPAIPKKNFNEAIDDFIDGVAASSDKVVLKESKQRSNKSKTYVNEDIETIHKFWYGFMDYVNKPSNKHKSMNECMRSYNAKYKKLNEAVWSLQAEQGSGIVNMGTKQLLKVLESNIRSQINSRSFDDNSNLVKTGNNEVLPILVWGAPGIGKTAILKQLNTSLSKSILGEPGNMNFIGVNCSSITSDSFSLPKIEVKPVTGAKVVNVPTSWMPFVHNELLKERKCFTIELENGETEEIEMSLAEYVNYFYNTGSVPFDTPDIKGANLSNEDEYAGGIILFDELSRMNDLAKNQIMTMILDKMSADGDYFLATRWAMVAAANRESDMAGETRDAFSWESAFQSRFQQVNFVPTKAEWLEWATGINKKTGAPNVDPIITKFIEKEDDSVWYDAIDFGSRGNKVNDITISPTATREDVESIMGSDEVSHMMTTWNPRIWADISNTYTNQLNYLIGKLNPISVHNSGTMDRVSKLFKKGAKVTGVRDANSVKEAVDPKIKKDNKLIDKDTGAVKIKDDKGDLQYTLDGSDKPSRQELEDRWNAFYDPSIDPNGYYKEYNIQNIKAYLKLWLQEIVIPMACGKDTLPYTKFKENNKFSSVFDDEQVDNIWKTGSMIFMEETADGEQYNADDLAMSASDFMKNPDFSWKGMPNKRKEVFNLLLEKYPGNMKSDITKSLKTAASYQGKNLSETLISKDVYHKWVEKLSFKIIPTKNKNNRPLFDKAQKFCLGDPFATIEIKGHGQESISMTEDGMYEDLAEKAEMSSTKNITPEHSKFGKMMAYYYTMNNFIDMLEKGDPFLNNICNFIKYLNKCVLEGESKSYAGIIKELLLGNHEAMLKQNDLMGDEDDNGKNGGGGVYDIKSVRESIVLSGQSDDLKKSALTNQYMLYIHALSALCDSINESFKQKAF